MENNANIENKEVVASEEVKQQKPVSKNAPDYSKLLTTLAIIGFILLIAKFLEAKFEMMKLGGAKNMVPLVPFETLLTNGFIHVANFLILAFLLRKYLFTPILDMMDKRKDQIEGDLQEAKEMRVEAEDTVKKHKEELLETQRKSSEIISHAINEAEKVKQDIVKDAKERSMKIIEESEKEIQREKEKVIIELRNEVGNIACEVAEKVITKTLKPEDHQEIIDKVINDIGK